MNRHERHRRIVETLNGADRLSVVDVSQELGVSEMTVRRDLKELETAGFLKRIYGGAVRQLGRAYEPPFRVRSQESAGPKAAIGRAAAALVEPGDAIAIDTGTTCYEAVKALQDAKRTHLTVVTASLRVAGEIASSFVLDQDLRLIVVGGVVRPGELSMIGATARAMTKTMHVDKALIGVGGIDVVMGCSEFNVEDAEVKQQFIESAKQVIVLADSTKLGRVVFASVCPIESVDVLVTDATIDPAQVAAFEAAGVRVVVAEG